MKIFKFFKGYNKNPIQNRLTRRYFGLDRGVIKWTELPHFQLFYLEPQYIEPNHAGQIAEVNMQMLTQTVSVETRRVTSFPNFLETNREKYIIVHSVITDNDNIFRQDNIHELNPTIPVMVRCHIIDPDE